MVETRSPHFNSEGISGGGFTYFIKIMEVVNIRLLYYFVLLGCVLILVKTQS